MPLTVETVQQAIRDHAGLDVGRFDSEFVWRSLARRLDLHQVTSPANYLERLSREPAEAEAFLQTLQVGYTEFFRSPLTFAMLEQLVLPALSCSQHQAAGAALRVWSAGCATGDEAYSVAMLLENLRTTSMVPVAARIFATDLDAAALATAQQGVYPEAALKNVRLRDVAKHFRRVNEGYAVVDEIRGAVEFSLFDLLQSGTSSPPAAIFGDFDLVLCCNVLIYYSPSARAQLLRRLSRSLAPHGYLVVGDVERSILKEHGEFEPVCDLAPAFRRRG